MIPPKPHRPEQQEGVSCRSSDRRQQGGRGNALCISLGELRLNSFMASADELSCNGNQAPNKPSASAVPSRKNNRFCPKTLIATLVLSQVTKGGRKGKKKPWEVGSLLSHSTPASHPQPLLAEPPADMHGGASPHHHPLQLPKISITSRSGPNHPLALQ